MSDPTTRGNLPPEALEDALARQLAPAGELLHRVVREWRARFA
jgi:hypothetical protein